MQRLDSARPHQGVLRAFVALDAFKRGHGQMFVISEYLCEMGYCAQDVNVCSAGKAAVMELDAKFGSQREGWWATPEQFEAMRLAVDVIDRQVKSASQKDYVAAYVKMNDYVENS